MNEHKICLTGIKPTGSPHLGNYLGAIRPALELAEKYDDARYFIADYHALNLVRDPQELRTLTREVAATWLACGLNPEKVVFYRQSDVPEIFELSTILMPFTAKGLMNRAHAYKAKVQENEDAQKDTDDGINMGLYTYPVLMAADILMFDTDLVPVGKDQIQHVEMCADIAGTFNFQYGKEALKIPRALVGEDNQLIIGLDGRKMSKSYNNTIPLFSTAKKLKKTVNRIKTNSQEVEESKDPDTCNVFALYRLFADKEEQEALARRYREGGMGWGEAKAALFEVLNRTLTPFREKYDALLADPGVMDRILEQGAARARESAAQKIRELRQIIGM